jgi:hypothetical protein
MTAKRLPYKEGTWFLVKLDQGGFGLGCVARHAPKGYEALGYFFDVKHARQIDADSFSSPSVREVILIEKFGDLGLINGSWPIIGTVGEWHREDWVVPRFLRVDAISLQPRLIEYNDWLDQQGEVYCDVDAIGKYPEDGMAGYGALAFVLEQMLSLPEIDEGRALTTRACLERYVAVSEAYGMALRAGCPGFLSRCATAKAQALADLERVCGRESLLTLIDHRSPRVRVCAGEDLIGYRNKEAQTAIRSVSVLGGVIGLYASLRQDEASTL